jgi:hypothetical protein
VFATAGLHYLADDLVARDDAIGEKRRKLAFNYVQIRSANPTSFNPQEHFRRAGSRAWHIAQF